MGAARKAITTGMNKLAGIFFHVQSFNADGFEVGVLTLLSHLNLNPTVLSDRFVVLGDLVILGQIGIEILLTVKLAMFGDLQIEG